MAWGDRSWLRSPCPAAGLTCPLTSLAQIWGYGGGFALHRTDAEAGGGDGVSVCIEFEQRESHSWVFLGACFHSWGWRARDASLKSMNGCALPCLARRQAAPNAPVFARQ